MHRYAPHAGVDSTFGEIALVSGAKPYGGFIVARAPGALCQMNDLASADGAAHTRSHCSDDALQPHPHHCKPARTLTAIHWCGSLLSIV